MPQARDFANELAVPLSEFEERHVVGPRDCRVLREDVLQEANPGLEDAGLTIGPAPQIRARRFCQSAEHRFGVRQRDATREMDDRLFGHGILLREVYTRSF
jgi:hypothetical protein